MPLRLATGFVLVTLFGVSPALAQTGSRVEQIKQQRSEKKETAAPDELSKLERRLNGMLAKRRLEKLTIGYQGLNLAWGGLPTGQGFAIGPSYARRDLLGGKMTGSVSARASSGRALLLDARAFFPEIANRTMFVDLYLAHRNSPRLDYFGQGPDSRAADRSNFRLESDSFDFTWGFTPFEYRASRPLRFGVTGGILRANPGPGNRSSLPQSAELFRANGIPGLDAQTTFWRGGVFAQYDYRDFTGEPRRGGNYLAKFLYYDDRTMNRHDFRRLELEAQQYIPFFADRRVIALRVKTELSFLNGTVPFYLQPVVGGSDDLRGFRAYRFYGDNSIVANAEYRFEAFTGLHAALFFDVGKVTDKRSQINFHDLEAAAGFGLRFNVANNVFMRVDVGFSHEGTRIWLKFGNVF